MNPGPTQNGWASGPPPAVTPASEGCPSVEPQLRSALRTIEHLIDQRLAAARLPAAA